MHGLVLRDHGADITSKATVAATGCGRVHHDGALSIWCCTTVDTEQLLVVDPPGVWLRDQVFPHVVACPAFDRGIDPDSREARVFVLAKPRAGAVLVLIHDLVACLTLPTSLTQHQDGFTVVL